ncbi:PorT family protein [Flavobacteriaceae bacterium]|nr:PorT family protein [Flavobacteriaceae bacterium]
MGQKCYFICCLFCVNALFAQNEVALDSLDTTYREDQFYFGITYNALVDTPELVDTRGLTGSVHFGFTRDMPINKRRNLSVALGIGASFDEYGSTLFIGEDQANRTIFTSLSDNDVTYDVNRFSTSSIEVPLEFRWRSSSAQNYTFWRFYAGVRLGYTYWYKSSFKQDGNTVTQTDIPEFNNMRLGATLSLGYNTVNFYAYYGITPFFDNAVTTNGTPIDMRTLKLGLLFFIL